MTDAGLSDADLALTFDALRAANVRRCETSFRHADWPPERWALATTGELGEFCNLLKKRLRGEDIPDVELARELADTVTYLDLLAWSLGIDLGAATREKFNVVSARVGSGVRL